MKKLLPLIVALLIGPAAEAGVTCSGTPCIDSTGGVDVTSANDWTGAQSFLDEGFTIKDTADPTKILNFETSSISAGQTRVATFPDASITVAQLAAQTFTGVQSFSSSVQFTGTSKGFANGTFRLTDGGGTKYVTISTTEEPAASDRTWLLNFGDANRTLTMTGDASLNQSVLTTSSPTFAGIGGAAGKIKMTGTAPALSACGSTTNGTIVGSDAAGRVVMGTQVAALVSCTQTFAVAYSAAPSCVVTPEVATSITVQALGYTVSSSAITYTGTDLDSVAVHYHCTLAS